MKPLDCSTSVSELGCCLHPDPLEIGLQQISRACEVLAA